MHFKTLLAVLLSSAILMSSVQKQDDMSIAQASNQFGLDYVNAAKEGNYFISPLSISTAMAMTYAGAKSNTASLFESVMHFNTSNGNFHELHGLYQQELNENLKGVKWNLANRLWGFSSEPFQKKFLEINKTFYKAPIVFGASEGMINTWVENQTNGMVKDLIPPGTITADTRLILTNAVYFKGDWKYAFKNKDTKKKDFFAPDQKVKVEMMFQKGVFSYAETPNYQAIKLPYKGGKQSMLVFLPKKNLKKIEMVLTANVIQLALRGRRANVNLHLPKFKLEYLEEFNEYLLKKGMETTFGYGADFFGI